MTLRLHATAVAVGDKSLVIIGPAGSGKSSLALQLMALGAGLIADDQVILSSVDGRLIASCPPSITGLIEARYVGVLNVDPMPPTSVVLAVDLGQMEQARVPEHHYVTWLNHEIPLLWDANGPHFPASLVQMLKAGRSLR
jgi:HPr kinase/phosphorylase